MTYAPGFKRGRRKLPALSDDAETAESSVLRDSTRVPSAPAPVSSTTLPVSATWAPSRHGSIAKSSVGSKRMDPWLRRATKRDGTYTGYTYGCKRPEMRQAAGYCLGANRTKCPVLQFRPLYSQQVTQPGRTNC